MRVVLIFAALALVSQCDGLICMCPSEAERACPDVSGCTAGTVMDICDCCRVCAKGLHETCGGTDHEMGKCGQGLYCKIRPTVEELIAMGVNPTENDSTTLNTMSIGNETVPTNSTMVEVMGALDVSSTTTSDTETSSAVSLDSEATSSTPVTNGEVAALGGNEMSSTTSSGQETTTKSAELDSSSTASVSKIIRTEIFGNETGICIPHPDAMNPSETNPSETSTDQPRRGSHHNGGGHSLLAQGISSGIGAGIGGAIGAGIGSAVGSSIGNRNRNNNNQYPSQQFSNQQYPSQQFPAQQYPSQQFHSQQFPAQQFPAQQFPAQQFPAHSSAGGIAPVGVGYPVAPANNAGPTLTRTVETYNSGVGGTPTHTKVVETYTGFGNPPTNTQGHLGTGSSNIGTGNQGNLGSGHYGAATTARSVHHVATHAPGFGSAYYGGTTRKTVHQIPTRAPGFGSAYYGATTRRSAARQTPRPNSGNYALSYATQRPASNSGSKSRPSSSSGKRKNNG